MILRYVLCAVIGYLLGSVSTGVLLAKRAGHDIRSEGSKSTGATNALRVAGVRVGLLTFVLDCLKTVIAIVLGLLIGGQPCAMAAAFAVIIGHNWPVFFGFKGGKGIACSCAAMVVLFPLQGGIAAALCLIVIALSRRVSLGSLVMLVLFAVLMCAMYPFWPYGAFAAALALVGIFRHRENVKRLISGTENTLSFKKK